MKKLLLSTVLLITLSYVSAQKLKIEKDPSWITQNNYSLTNWLTEDVENGYIDLLYEKQICLEKQSVYIHSVSKILSEAGIQNNSEVNVVFDPSYQELIFHSVRIIRDGKSLNRLSLAKFKLIHEEKELSRFIYNGHLSAVLILDDVRKGDIIEYSYTLNGFNPIFNGKFAACLETNFSVPIALLYYKIIVPKDRIISIKNTHTEVKASVKEEDKQKVYDWKIAQQPSLHVPARAPSWFDPFGEIYISEYKDWKEVNGWAKTLFSFDTQLSPDLQNKVREINNMAGSQEDKILTALRFVQDEIRYMGIEMGQNSHQPHNPNEILKQRFGDCKDKSYLLCTILRALKIEAYPVLINTEAKHTIAENLPSPLAFDHTTVQVKLGEKKFWLDPTISYQRGPIQSIYFPDYQLGLVVSDSSSGLTVIPALKNSLVRIKENFKIHDQTAQLIVTTSYSGNNADFIRARFHDDSQYEIKHSFQKFYASYFKGIQLDSLNAKEGADGCFVTIESYSIPNFWQDEKGVKKMYFTPYLINSILTKPDDEKRAVPISLNYPTHYVEDIDAELPENWDLQTGTHDIKCADFKLDHYSKSDDRRLLLHYDYETLQDHIDPQDMDKYAAACKEADEKMDYEISWNNYSSTQENTAKTTFSTSNSIYSKLYILLGICAITTYLVRRNRQKGL
jgi:transglutaminase-like putative cysteine protease